MITILSKFYPNREVLAKGHVMLFDGRKNYQDQKLGYGKQESFTMEISISIGDK